MGSTFLLQLLTCEGDFLFDINAKINYITQQSNSLKNDIKSIIDDENVNLNAFMNENMKLKSQAENLITDMRAKKEHINSKIKPELSSRSLELKSLSRSLQEINMYLHFINEIIEIHSSIKTANTKMQNKEFHECAKIITSVQDVIKNDENDLKHLDIFKTLSNEAVLCYEHLLHQINELWMTLVTFEVTNGDCESKRITCSIDVNSASKMSDLLQALNCLNYTIIEKKFIDLFLSNVINYIIMHKVRITVDVGDKAVLTLETLDAVSKPQYSEVFVNLGTAINFLKNHLNIKIKDDISFLHKIGTILGNEMAVKLIEDCLTQTVPTSSQNLEKYNDVVRCTEEFEAKLKECGFLPEKSTCLLDYAKNINVLFANKFCQSYLEKARMLMKKDLHITTTHEPVNTDISILPKSHRNILKNKLNIQDENGVISLPKCQISKAAEEVVDLVNGMINEIMKSQDMCAVRLFYTIRNIFEMYSAIVPLHHRKFLDTLPQQVALFHNNCMYFTHVLISITCEYYKKIPSILNDHFIIFLEEAILLRTLAVESLEHHVTSQKNQLVYILRDSGIATLNEDPKLDPNSEKSIRQCIRQLQLLQSVWKDVLPLSVYNRAIGFLLDSVMEELMSLLMVVDDISSQTATDLASMFTIIVERTPILFTEPKEIFRHAKKWQKFNEFILILKGSLRDIDDRWSDGMGPLSMEFTPEQVKQLIRALFQNSERRSALLNKIK